MRAVRFDQYGDVDVLNVVDVPVPAVREGSDLAGVVEQVEPGAERWQPGDEVIG